MGSKNSTYGTTPSEMEYPTYEPKWLTRNTVQGARYLVIDGLAFEVTPGEWFGYHIDRIDMNGYYLGETCWIEKWKDLKATCRAWYDRPYGYGNWTAEDVLGDDEGNPTAIARKKGYKHKASVRRNTATRTQKAEAKQLVAA